MHLQTMTIQKGYYYPRGMYTEHGKPEEAAAYLARRVRKGFTQKVPSVLDLEGYIGVCQVW